MKNTWQNARLEKIKNELTEERVRKAFADAHCKTLVSRSLGLGKNTSGKVGELLNELITKYAIDTSHFDHVKMRRRNERTMRECPVCGVKFEVQVGTSNEKTVCSRSCANMYFRSGENNWRAQQRLKRIEEVGETFREICWRHHPKICIVCGEQRIVEAHHYNGNHDDNRPENFAPLCPTHHQYWHSRHRHLIQDQVDKYVQNFISRYKPEADADVWNIGDSGASPLTSTNGT